MLSPFSYLPHQLLQRGGFGRCGLGLNFRCAPASDHPTRGRSSADLTWAGNYSSMIVCFNFRKKMPPHLQPLIWIKPFPPPRHTYVSPKICLSLFFPVLLPRPSKFVNYKYHYAWLKACTKLKERWKILTFSTIEEQITYNFNSFGP